MRGLSRPASWDVVHITFGALSLLSCRPRRSSCLFVNNRELLFLRIWQENVFSYHRQLLAKRCRSRIGFSVHGRGRPAHHYHGWRGHGSWHPWAIRRMREHFLKMKCCMRQTWITVLVSIVGNDERITRLLSDAVPLLTKDSLGFINQLVKPIPVPLDFSLLLNLLGKLIQANRHRPLRLSPLYETA